MPKVPLLVPACYRLSCVRGVVVPSAPPPLVPVPARPLFALPVTIAVTSSQVHVHVALSFLPA
jgi:hypothetical protein